MATTRESRKGGSFGWFLIGILVGAVLVAGAYVYFTGDRDEAPVPPAEPAEAEAPVLQAAPDTAPAAEPPQAPAAPAATPPPPVVTPDEERQLADDAAAAGMTGPAEPAADQPTN